MNIIRYSVGVDISKDNFHAAVLTTNNARAHKIQRSGTFDNAPAGFELFIKWCRKEHKQPELPLAIAMEATGTYHERLALALHLAGFTVHIVLPNRAKAYIASFSTGSKTDTADARDLARMCAEQPLGSLESAGRLLLHATGSNEALSGYSGTDYRDGQPASRPGSQHDAP